MNSQEREIISGIFKRLEQAANQPRDPETERFITDKIRSQPYAPYAMAQLIYVQEEAIKSLNQQVEELPPRWSAPGANRNRADCCRAFLAAARGRSPSRSARRRDRRGAANRSLDLVMGRAMDPVGLSPVRGAVSRPA